MSAAVQTRYLHLIFRCRHLWGCAVVVLVVLYGIGAPRVHAQNNGENLWRGTVEVSPTTLTLRPGQSLSYRLRLTEPPTADGWWVMVHVDGVVHFDGRYKGITWVPSVGWDFNQDNWDQWRGIVIRTDDDAELGTVTFTHEVWDHTAECPVHNASPVTVELIDNGLPPILPELEIDDVTVDEDGGSAVFRVSLSKQSTATVTVEYATEAGTAEAGTDYTARSGTLVFLAGETEQTIAVPVVDDSEDEITETFTMTLSVAHGATLGDREGTATIRDDDGPPAPPILPELEIDDVTVDEDGGSAVFRVSLSKQSTATVTVEYATEAGTAEAGTDYTARSGTLVFLAGETEQTIAVPVVDDNADEITETFTMRLSEAHGATLGDREGTATIRDDDEPPAPPILPELEIDDVTVDEDGGSAVFRVSLSKQSTATVTVEYATEAGTAEAGTDYTARSGTLVFLAGETEQTIAVPVVDDNADEITETFTMRLSEAHGATLGDREGTATIRDDDGPPAPPGLPTLAINDVTVAEDGGSAVFSVRLSGESTATVTVGYATEAGTAHAGSDYTAGSGTLTFESGESRKTIAVAVIDDSEEEGSETFTVRLSDVRNATLLDGEGTATIRDDDGDGSPQPPGLPTLAIDDVTVAEDGGSAVFGVRLSGESTATVTVGYATEDGTAHAGSDYTAGSGTLTFESGAREQTIAVAVIDDSEEEGSETFTVQLSDARNATLLDGEGTATIRDDDADGDGSPQPPGLPTLAINDVTVAEDGGSAVFSVRLSGASSATVTVGYATLDGTADAGTDYIAGSGTLTFESGESRKTIAVAVIDDSEEEGSETFTVRLSDARNATLLDGEGTATIRDDDADGDGSPQPPGLPTLAIDDVTVAEDGGSAVFGVRLSGESTATVTVGYATEDGTAHAGSDYTAGSGTLTFESGAREQTIAVAVVDDSEEEGSETFTVRLSDVRNATLLDGEGTATIRDDDGDGSPQPPGLPTLAIDDVTVAEDGGSAVFSVRLSGESTATVAVGYATEDGTAHAGSDYTAGSGTLTFESGAREQTIAVAVIDDSEEEGSETFTVRLSDVRNATLLDGEGTATIRDDDGDGSPQPPGLPTLAINDVTVAEDGGSAVFSVRLSGASSAAVTVGYATEDGTAHAGSDYTAGSGTLTFESGAREQTIAVAVIDDSEEEGSETFTVRLSDVRNATLLDGEGTATIRDDEYSGVRVSYGAESYTVKEGEFVAVEVVLSASPDRPLTIPLTHVPGNGAGRKDYSGVPESVRFDSFETRKTFNVTAEEDDEHDDGESIILGFGTLPPGVRAAVPERSTVTITDDPQPKGRIPTDWLREFGGTAAAHVVDALDERMRCAPYRRSEEAVPDHAAPRWRCTRYPGPSSFVVNGRRLDALLAMADASVSVPGDDTTRADRRVYGFRSLSAGEVAAGSSFHVLSTEQEYEPGLSLWGRGSFSRFERREDEAVLRGDVGSATFGADFAADRALVGIALSHSEGDGTVSLDGVAGQVAASLTGLHPYLRLGVNERLSLWGTAGLGSGTLMLTMKDAQSIETGITMRMAAAGALAEILSPTEDNEFSVAIKADALLLQIVADASTSLAAASADATRLRLVLEGAHEIVLEDGEWIAPFVDVGVRYDGGDAETGLGAEIGGGLRYAHPAHNLTAEVDTRVLLVHAADDFERWSVSGSLRYDPSSNSELGPYFTFSSSGGVGELDGQDTRLGLATFADPLADAGATIGWSIDTEFGYGVPVLGDSATGTPWVGLSLSEGRSEYRLGYRLGLDSDLHLGIEGVLRDSATVNEPPVYAVILLLSLT